MVTKDWRKTITSDGKLIIFLNKRKPFAVRIQKFSNSNKWYYDVETVNPRAVLIEKDNLTKAQALTYAKSYMRKH